MLCMVFFALARAGFAYIGADPADRPGLLTPARHVASGEPTDLGAVDVQRDASGHRLGIGFTEACDSAVVASVRAVVARFDTFRKRFMSHDSLQIVCVYWRIRKISLILGSASRAAVSPTSINPGRESNPNWAVVGGIDG